MDRLRANAPIVLLGVALAASSALLLALGSQLTFFGDTWAFLIDRRGDSLGDYLRPHNEHISVIPVALQKLAIAWFGMGSDLPSRVLLTAMLAATAALLFVYVRRRIGPWPALIAAAIVLFLGPAWEDLLWPFQISLVGSMLFGLAMLLALERGDARGDLGACAFLAISIGCSSLGVSFAAGALVDVAMRRRERGLGRAWVALGPLLLYAAWYLGWGHEAASAISIRNLLRAPLFVAESIAGSAGSVLGLRALVGGVDGNDRFLPGLLAALALLALLALWWLRRDPGAWRRALRQGRASRLWPVLAVAAAFWLAAAVNDAPGRSPLASRYMYIGAVLLLLIAANLLRGTRISARGLAVAGAIAALAIASNVVVLLEGRDRLRRESVLTRADLGAIEIARDTVPPSFRLEPALAGTPTLINVAAGPYLELVEEHGSPAYDTGELARAPEFARNQADVVLGAALPVGAATRAGRSPAGIGSRKCARSGGADPAEVPVPAGTSTVVLSPGPGAVLALRRFSPAASAPVRFDEVPGGSTTRLTIPRDRARGGWRLRVESAQPARVCSRRGGGRSLESHSPPSTADTLAGHARTDNIRRSPHR